MSADSKLFQPVQIGSWQLRNHIAMAPLTRCRATSGTDAPNALNALYYRQRATAGLIISEATQISLQGKGYAGAPGIYSSAQVVGWDGVTTAVHEEGGTIVAQLWHVGRISHPSLQPNGELPVAPSAVKPKGKANTPTGLQDMVTPRALDLNEIPSIIADYAHAANQAKAAGFDGVEIHAANGYLLDQFLRDSTNQRTDIYGGSLENRARLTLEVIDAIIPIWGKGRIGIRLSPVSNANDMTDSNPQSIFGYLVEQIDKRDIAYIHYVEGNTGRERDIPGFDWVWARRAFRGAYIANNGYTLSMACEAIASATADMIAFGKPYISNPDLVQRLKQNAPLNTPDSKSFYGGNEQGYTDYPFLVT